MKLHKLRHKTVQYNLYIPQDICYSWNNFRKGLLYAEQLFFLLVIRLQLVHSLTVWRNDSEKGGSCQVYGEWFSSFLCERPWRLQEM